MGKKPLKVSERFLEKKREREEWGKNKTLVYIMAGLVLLVGVAIYWKAKPDVRPFDLEVNPEDIQKIPERYDEPHPHDISHTPTSTDTIIPEDLDHPSLESVPRFLPFTEEELKEREKNKKTAFQVEGKIPKVRWSPDHPFIHEAVNRGLPVVLTNTAVKEWKALDTWTPEYIAEKINKFDGVYKHNKKIFGPYWDSARPMSTFPSIKRRNGHEVVTMDSQELVKKIREGESVTPVSHHYYYSGNVNNIGELVLDLDPWDYLELDPESKVQNMNFWMGQKGTTADLHYDAFENVNVQVLDRKKWTIFPPDASVYLYPFLHPSHAQAQAVTSQPDLERFPKIKEAKALEVILEPGELLYLPPLYFHHVEALDTSISINCWSFSNQTNFMKEATAKASPLKQSDQRKWTNAQKSVAIRTFLTLLIDELKGEGKTTSFIQDLKETRYGALVADGELSTEGAVCGTSSTFLRKDLKSLKKEFKSEVTEIVSLMRSLPQNTQDVWLGNFVEFLAFHVDNSANNVAGFLDKCFTDEE